MWRLVGIQGVYKGRFFNLNQERLVIGKEEPCGVCLNEDEAVAEKQAELVFCNGNYMYRDMDSRCPTVLNGSTVCGMTALNNGDSIQIGESIFRVENVGVQPQSSEPCANMSSGQTLPTINTSIAPQTSVLAIVSIVMSVIAPLIGLVLGIISLKQINRSRGAQTGEGLATAAIIISGIGVMLTLLILPSIAIPNFIKAREVSRANLCINNLKQIHVAKEQWALDNRQDIESTIGWTDIIGASKYIKEQPVCPSGGTYELRPIGTGPTCSVKGHALWHD